MDFEQKTDLLVYAVAMVAIFFLVANYFEIIFFEKQILISYFLLSIFAAGKVIISLLTGQIGVYPNNFIIKRVYTRKENPFYYWFHLLIFLGGAIGIFFFMLLPQI